MDEYSGVMSVLPARQQTDAHLFAGLAVAREAIVQAQGAFRADGLSRPQPDLALFRWRDDFYAAALARPDDVLLPAVAVAVADVLG